MQDSRADQPFNKKYILGSHEKEKVNLITRHRPPSASQSLLLLLCFMLIPHMPEEIILSWEAYARALAVRKGAEKQYLGRIVFVTPQKVTLNIFIRREPPIT